MYKEELREQIGDEIREELLGKISKKVREEGREESRIENARALIKKGADKDFVIDALELTESEIKALDD